MSHWDCSKCGEHISCDIFECPNCERAKNFPNCRDAGLNVRTETILVRASNLCTDYEEQVICAADVEPIAKELLALRKEIADAPVVMGWAGECWNDESVCEGKDEYTHAARLINIKPIVKDTAESILRDLISTESNCGGVEKLAERAKELLGVK